MEQIPEEVIFRHAFSEAAKFFAGKIEEKRREGFVAVLVEDFYHSLFFFPCNRDGYPKMHNLKSLELPKLEHWLTIGDTPPSQNITCYEVEIMCERPLIMSHYHWQQTPLIFMWSGRKMGRNLVPVEKLNVSELMRVAQAAIKNREGLIVDEVLKNKIYK